MHRYVALDSLRGLAALLVLAYHFDLWLPLGTFASSSWIGVDFFFVLSGFVIAAAYRDRLAEGLSLRRFGILRLGRIYPVHLVVLLTWFVIIAAGKWIEGDMTFAGARSMDKFFWTLLLLQSVVVNGPVGWSPQSWSISVEMLLYATFALIWLRCGQWATAICIGVAVLASLGLTAGQDWTVGLGLFGLARGLAGFALGVLCWIVRRRVAAPTFGWATASEIFVLGLGLCAVAAQTEPGRIVLADFAFAAVVFVFAADQGALSRILSGRPFVLLGMLSYSFYMVHLLVLFAMRVTLDRLARMNPPDSGAGVTGLLALSLCLTLVAAWILWQTVEAPARARSRILAARFGVSAEERVAPTI